MDSKKQVGMCCISIPSQLEFDSVLGSQEPIRVFMPLPSGWDLSSSAWGSAFPRHRDQTITGRKGRARVNLRVSLRMDHNHQLLHNWSSGSRRIQDVTRRRCIRHPCAVAEHRSAATTRRVHTACLGLLQEAVSPGAFTPTEDTTVRSSRLRLKQWLPEVVTGPEKRRGRQKCAAMSHTREALCLAAAENLIRPKACFLLEVRGSYCSRDVLLAARKIIRSCMVVNVRQGSSHHENSDSDWRSVIARIGSAAWTF
jgi:hypothetical protein